MAKILSTRYELVSLDDVPQSTPYPAGYSPLLPTPPGTSPTSTGINVLDQYIAETVIGAGVAFAKTVLSVSGVTATFSDFPYTNYAIYNPGPARFGIYATAATTPAPVVALEVSTVTMVLWTLMGNTAVTGWTVYNIGNTTKGTTGPRNTNSTTQTLTLFSWRDNPPQG